MPLFHPKNKDLTARHAALYATYEIAYSLVDFGAAVLFIIGSIMFFSDAWVTFGTWLFLLGSILFACKPTLRLICELRLVAMGDTQSVADKLES